MSLSPHDVSIPTFINVNPSVPASCEAPVNPSAPSSCEAKVKKRSPNWLPPEEEQLAQSWLNVSQLPEFLANQSGEGFYLRVEEDFNIYSKIHYRDADQIRIRWAALNTATLKFSAIYGYIERMSPPDTGPLDWMRLAKQRYSEQTKGQTFKLENAWEKLRYAPKWIQAALGAPPNSIDLTSEPDGHHSKPGLPVLDYSTPVGPSNLRPIKRPREESENEALGNTRLGAVARMAEVASKRLEALEDGNKLAREMMAIDREAKQSQILMNDLTLLMKAESDCPDDTSREILRLMKENLRRKYVQSSPGNL